MLETLNILQLGLKEVFSKKEYILKAMVFAFVFLFLFLWFPNASLLFSVLGSSSVGAAEKISFFLDAVFLLESNFTLFSAFILLLESFLFGLNIAMFMYYSKMKRPLTDVGGASIVGTVAGFLGMGCASCGSVLLSIFGFSGAVAILPFGGHEFGFIAIALFIFSLYVLSKRVSQKTCEA